MAFWSVALMVLLLAETGLLLRQMERSELEQAHCVVGDHVRSWGGDELLAHGRHLLHRRLGLSELLGGEVIEGDAVGERRCRFFGAWVVPGE